MDILTEIYRIKQVMGLITEQNDESLVDENVYDAIKNIESVFSLTDEDGNIKARPELTGKEKEQNIKNVIQDTIGLDYWKKMNPKLQGQVYSFMYQADSDTNSFYRWLAGLYDAIILDENEKNTKMPRSDIFTNKVPKLDVNGKETGVKEILPRNALPLEKQNNIKSAIKKVQDAIINNKINYDKYMDIVKKQYETLEGTPNDAANRKKIWGPRPEALNKLMSNESWEDVKAWWYKKIGESSQTTQVANTPSQKDSASVSPNVVQPPVVSQKDSIPPTNTAQQNTDAPAITTPQTPLTQQSTEELKLDTFKDGELGDPYVYIQNTSGDFLTFKCGKRNEKCPGLVNKQYNDIPWINVTKGRIAGKPDYITYENGIRVDIYGYEALPTGQQEPNQTEETTPENDTNSKIKKAFRNKYYKFLINEIKRKVKDQGFDKVTKTPCLTDNTSGCINDYIIVVRKSTDNTKYVKINLDTTKMSVNGLPSTDISDSLLNIAMNKFTNQMIGTGITIGDKTYKIRENGQNSIIQLSNVFDADTTQPKHTKNKKVQNLNASKTFYIYKA